MAEDVGADSDGYTRCHGENGLGVWNDNDVIY